MGEILEDQFGVCFLWGIYVSNKMLNVDFQYFVGVLHLFFYQFLLMLHLSYQIERRFLKLTSQDDIINSHQTNAYDSQSSLIHTVGSLSRLKRFLYIKSYVIFHKTIENISFLVLIATSLFQIKDLYLAYSIISVILCPLKTWLLVLAIYLRHKCINLTVNDFEKFIDNSKTSHIINRDSHSMLTSNFSEYITNTKGESNRELDEDDSDEDSDNIKHS